MPASAENPIIDVLERGCSDLIAGRRTYAAAAIRDKFPIIARSATLRKKVRDGAKSLPKMISDFTPDRAALPFSTRARALTQQSQTVEALLPRFRFEIDELQCLDETNPEPFGHDEIYVLWGATPLAPNTTAVSGKAGKYTGLDDGDRRQVDTVMYEGPALGMSYALVMYEEDRGDWVAAYDEFARNVSAFWNEDVLPLVGDIEDALDRVGEIPVVGGTLSPTADTAGGFLAQAVGFIERIAGWIDGAIRKIFDLLGFEDDAFPEIVQTLDLAALLDIPMGQSRELSHTRSAHGGRYRVKVDVTHLPYPVAAPGNTSTRRPCLHGTDEELSLLWSGASSRRELNVRTGRSYKNFGSKVVQSVDGLRGEPTAVEWKGKTVVAWVERYRSRDHVMVGVLDRNDRIGSITMVPDSRGAKGVSACVHAGRLYLMWNGSGTRVQTTPEGGGEAAPLQWRPNDRCRLTSTSSDIGGGRIDWSDSEPAGASYQSPQLVSHDGKLFSVTVDQDGTMVLMTKSSAHPRTAMMSHQARQSIKVRGPVGAVSHGGRLLLAHADRRTGKLSVSTADVGRMRVEVVQSLSDASRHGVGLCSFAGVPHLGWIDANYRIQIRPYV